MSYLPHRSFYSQKLIAIRKQKEEKPVQPLKLNLYDLNRQETIRSHRTERKIKTRAKSMANLCKSGSRTKINDE